MSVLLRRDESAHGNAKDMSRQSTISPTCGDRSLKRSGWKVVGHLFLMTNATESNLASIGSGMFVDTGLFLLKSTIACKTVQLLLRLARVVS
jgi:hypothetical protein